MKDDLKKVQKALIKLYLTVKIRKKEDADNITEEILKEEEAKLLNQNLMSLVEYIKSSIDVLVTIKVEEQLAIERADIEEDNEYAAEKYETLLKKEESDIRQHISIEHQLKIHAERLANHIEDLERENDSLIKQLEKYEKIKKNEEQYTVEINNIKQVLKSYEDQNLKLSQNEKRLKAKLLQKEKDIKHLEKKMMNRTASSSQLLNNASIINNNINSNNNINNEININSSSHNNHNNGNGNNYSNSVCYHSRSKSKISDDEKKEKHHSFIKKSPIPIERVKVQDKINEYHKLMDRKVHLSKNKSMRTSRDKSSCSNMSYLSKERSIDNDLSTITKRNEELTQRLHDLTLKVIKNEERKNKTPMKRIPSSNKKNAVYERKKENKIIATKLLKKSPSEIGMNQSDMLGGESIDMTTNHNHNNYNNSHVNHNSNNSFLNQNGNKTINQLNYKQLLYSKCSNNSGNMSISLKKKE